MNDTDFAIVVGINNYPQLPLLKGAHRDAMLFKDWLLSPSGGNLPESNVRLILSSDDPVADPFEAQPGKADIDRALRDFGIDRVLREFSQATTDGEEAPIEKLGRRLYFYFSGHGVGPDFDEVAMLMANASLTMLNNNMGMRPYRSLLHRLALFSECVFIMDCCRDPVGGITPAGPALSVPLSFPARGPCDPVIDFVVMAADWGRKALERTLTDDEQTNRLGVLTSHFVRGLTNGEAADGEGRITSQTLQKYLSSKMNGDQTPNFIGPSRGEILFATIPKQQIPTVEVRLLAPAGLTGHLILSDGSFNEIARPSADQLTTAHVAWTGTLERNRIYILEHIVNGQKVGSPIPLDLRTVNSPYDFTFANTP